MPARQKFKVDHEDPIVRELEIARSKLECSQREMAEKLGVPHRTYQKWVYGKQSPRHAQALLARASAIASRRRVNCWEVIECERAPGGRLAHEKGVCPAAVDRSADGVNAGSRGGRVCWAISGTFCGLGNGTEGSIATKLVSCLSCSFFQQVMEEEGLAHFKLLKPGQTYTQT